MKKLLFILLITSLISCSSDEEMNVQPEVQTQETETKPAPPPTQYTLTVTSSEGGSVSTEGGTYDEGTSINITATADEGYQFVGWEGSDETGRGISNIN